MMHDTHKIFDRQRARSRIRQAHHHRHVGRRGKDDYDAAIIAAPENDGGEIISDDGGGSASAAHLTQVSVFSWVYERVSKWKN